MHQKQYQVGTIMQGNTSCKVSVRAINSGEEGIYVQAQHGKTSTKRPLFVAELGSTAGGKTCNTCRLGSEPEALHEGACHVDGTVHHVRLGPT